MQIYIKYRKDGKLHEEILEIGSIELVNCNVVLTKPVRVQHNGILSSLKDYNNQDTINFDNIQIDKENQKNSSISLQEEFPDTIKIYIGDIIKLDYLPENHNNAVIMCWVVIGIIMLLASLFSGNHHNKNGFFENLSALVFFGMFFYYI